MRTTYRAVRSRFWGLLGGSLLMASWLGLAVSVAFMAWFMISYFVALASVVLTKLSNWVAVTVGVLGGIVASVYRITVALSNNAPEKGFVTRCIFRVTGGALAGAGAYLLADLDVIGVKLDTSSPRTFCILGFLVAYIGLDVIMGKFSSSRQEGGKPKEIVTETHEPQAAPKTAVAARVELA